MMSRLIALALPLWVILPVCAQTPPTASKAVSLRMPLSARYPEYDRFLRAQKNRSVFLQAPTAQRGGAIGAMPPVPPNLPTSGVIDLIPFTLPDDPYPLLQGIVDNTPPNKTTIVKIGETWRVLSHPVVVDKDNIKFIGLDKLLSGFWCFNAPPFIVGNKRDGGVDSHWVPTALDQTAAGRLGFASKGDTVIQMSNHLLSLGWKSRLTPSQPETPDHWAEIRGYTVSLAYNAMGNQVSLVSTCRFGFDPQGGPTIVHVPQADGSALLIAFFRLANGQMRTPAVRVRNTGLVRADLIFDFNAQRFTANIDGTTPTIYNDTSLPVGFARGDGRYSTNFGCDGLVVPDGPQPNFILYGAKFVASAVYNRPRQDSWYFDQTTPNCVTTFSGVKDVASQSRLIPFLDGNSQRSYAWAFTTTTNHAFQSGNAVENLTLWGNPALQIGEVSGTSVKNNTLGGNLYGLGSQTRGASYPLHVHNNSGWGNESFLNLLWVLSYDIQNLTSIHGGNAHVRLTGCQGSWQGGILAGVSNTALSAVEILRFYGNGGPHRLVDVMSDSEGFAFPRSIFYAEDTDNNPSSFHLTNCLGSVVGPNAAFLWLDHSDASTNASVSVFGASLTGGGGNSCCYVGGNNIKGSINFLGKGNLPVTGPGAAGVIKY